MNRVPWSRRIAAVASLGDENRRKLFEFVAAAGTAVGRDDAAGALGLPRSTASFHLDRLVQDGLLAVEFRKLGGKAGPGSGRPAKMYRAAVEEVRRPFRTATTISPVNCWSRPSKSRRPPGIRPGALCVAARYARPGRGGRAGGGEPRGVPRRRRATCRSPTATAACAAELPVPPARRRPRGGGLRHERRVPGRGRGGVRHGSGPCGSARRRGLGPGSAPARASAAPGSGRLSAGWPLRPVSRTPAMTSRPPDDLGRLSAGCPARP